MFQKVHKCFYTALGIPTSLVLAVPAARQEIGSISFVVFVVIFNMSGLFMLTSLSTYILKSLSPCLRAQVHKVEVESLIL